MSARAQIPSALSQMAKKRLCQHHPSTDDVLPGTFFDDPNYFDSMPYDAKAIACGVHVAGYGTNPSVTCHQHSKILFQSFLQNNDLEYLLSSMAVEAMALRWMSAEQPERGEFNDLMGILYNHKFDHLSRDRRDPNDLDQAIRHANLSSPYFEEDREKLSRISVNLADLHIKRYQLSRQDSDLDKAEEYLDQAVGLAGSTLGQVVITKFKIRLAREAVQTWQTRAEAYMLEVSSLLDSLLLQPPYSLKPLFGETCQAAGEFCMILYREFENIICIEKSISYLAKSIVLLSGSSSPRDSAEQQLTEARQLRNRIQRDSQDIETSLIVTKNLIEDAPQVLIFRVQLAELYREEGLNATEPQLRQKGLDDAVSLMENVVAIMPASFNKRGWVHDRCSAAYYSRFDAHKIDDDIDEAIAQSTKASEAVENEYTWSCYHLLSQCLLERYEKHENPEDLRAASAAIEEAVTRTIQNPVNLAECKWIVGKIRWKEYLINPAKEETLAETIAAFEAATHSLPNPSVSRALALHDLGNAYLTRFKCFPDPQIWGNCVDSLEKSVGIMKTMYPDPEHPHILMLNSSLGGAMLERFRHDHLEQNLESSIEYFRKALGSLTPLDAGYTPRAGNLCQALRELFEVRGEKAELKLLEEGQNMVCQALSNSETLGGPDKTWLESQLGDLFTVSYQRTNLESDKSNAIQHYDKALDLPDVSSRYKACIMTNKAVLLKHVAENTGLEEDFRSSYDAFRDIAQAYPQNDSNAWLNTYNYANLAYKMHEKGLGNEGPAYSIVSLDNYKAVAEDQAVPLGHRITAASLAASIAHDIENNAGKARDFIMI